MSRGLAETRGGSNRSLPGPLPTTVMTFPVREAGVGAGLPGYEE